MSRRATTRVSPELGPPIIRDFPTGIPSRKPSRSRGSRVPDCHIDPEARHTHLGEHLVPDLFPMTSHVECVVILEPIKKDA